MESTTTNNALVEKLESRNIKPTAMRLLVLEYLVEQHFNKSDRTTLYRTLKTFEDKGLVHEIHDLSGSAKYALCADDCSCTYPDDVHVHFYCNSCKKTFCFPDRPVPSISLPEEYQPLSGDFVINGICPACRNWLNPCEDFSSVRSNWSVTKRTLTGRFPSQLSFFITHRLFRWNKDVFVSIFAILLHLFSC